MPVQTNWCWCNKCQALAFGGGLSPGMCPSGGQHDHSGSGEYSLVRDDPAALGQSNWRHCGKCETLAYAGNATLGSCAAGGPHDYTGSGNYVLVKPPVSPFTQDKWARCIKCEAFVYTGNASLGTCPKDKGLHDHTGSPDYTIELHDRSAPIDQAISRHLLTAFGPCNDAVQARATLKAACTAMIAKGGGVIVIPSSVPTDFLPRNAIQDVVTKTGVLIEDFRGGALRLVVLPEGVIDSNSDTAGGMILERDLVNDVQGQGGGSALSIANRSRGGVNSINDVIQRDVSPGTGARFYVTSLRGLCPGNWVNIANQAGQTTSGPIKAVDLDGDNPYFVADTQFSFQKGDRFWNKNWFGAVDIADVHNTDDQSGTVSIARTTYGTGDTFGVQMSFTYSGDIMSAGGDEGGVVYSAEVRQDVDLFWGEVEHWDPQALELVYKPAPDPQDPPDRADLPLNFWKIGTSRPIINMNPSTWITSGKVIVPQTGYNYNDIPSSVVGNPDVQWDQSIIGKFITINEPAEYWDPDPQGPDKDLAYALGHRIVRRWFRVATLEKRKDGLWNLGIETVWWGNYEGGRPALMNDKSYFWGTPKELRYIIAPGSWVIDVRNALGPRKYYVGGTPQERTIRLAPFQNAQNAFKPGDVIAQPAGPTPWTPTAYRTRNFNLFPPLMPGSCFVAGNLGPTVMGAGLLVDDGRPGRSLATVLNEQKDGQPPFGSGVDIASPTNYGLYISGPVRYSAIAFQQVDGNKKAIDWVGNNVGTSVYGDPTNGNFTIETTGNVNLSLKGTIQQSGLSATSVAAKNLRGIGVPVAGNSSVTSIVFATPEPDASYSILSECDWLTVKAVQNKTPNGFTVQFATAAPVSGGHLDWLLVR